MTLAVVERADVSVVIGREMVVDVMGVSEMLPAILTKLRGTPSEAQNERQSVVRKEEPNVEAADEAERREERFVEMSDEMVVVPEMIEEEERDTARRDLILKDERREREDR